MKESLLHYLWKSKILSTQELNINSGEKLEILNTGIHNHDSGPDFSNAKIKIGDTIWAGNVEIHVNASDFLLHKHQLDKRYDNIILHVVYEEDIQLNFPTLELKKYIPASVYNRYNELTQSNYKLPCSAYLKDVEQSIYYNWIDRNYIDRLEEKADSISEIFKRCNNNTEQTFFILLCIAFGQKTNKLAFESLAFSLPLNIIFKHSDNLFQLEALLFGQAGLLDKSFDNPYLNQLQNEYAFLQKKYKLTPLDSFEWKFHRMRPANFPTLRLAQLAGFLKNKNSLSSILNGLKNEESLKKLFDFETSEYWQKHYTTDGKTLSVPIKQGKQFQDSIAINCFIPFAYFTGKRLYQNLYLEVAENLILHLKPEKNQITRLFENNGKKPLNALESQAMLQLHKKFCTVKICENCGIGNYILKNL